MEGGIFMTALRERDFFSFFVFPLTIYFFNSFEDTTMCARIIMHKMKGLE
jgi:hypothetical protein